MSLYQQEEEITMFGEKIKISWTKRRQITNGSFSDPKQLASFIPANSKLDFRQFGRLLNQSGLET